MFRPAFGTITVPHVDIIVAKSGKRIGCLSRQLADAFDGVNIAGEFGQYRRRVTRAGANLENLFVTFEHQGFRHEGNDIGLRNRLVAGDRKRRVLIGKLAEFIRQEQLARHFAHGLEDAFVAHPALRNIPLDHFTAERSKGIAVVGIAFFRC